MPSRSVTASRVVAIIIAAAVAVAAAGDADALHDIGIEVTIEPEEVTVGDPITVTVDVTAAGDLPITFPLVGSLLGPLTVLEVLPPEAPVREGERLRHRAVYRLAAYQPGEAEIPPFEILVGEAEGAAPVRTEARTVQVRSVLDEDAEGDGAADLADIRPQASLPFGRTWWILALAGALVAAALLAVWWWRRRRHVPEVAPAPGPPPIPADEEALAALDRLVEGPLLGKGKIKAFHVELAEIAKRYLWRRYEVPTLERTTFEVLREARAAAIEPPIIEGFGAVLSRCDGVKFARQRPDPAMSRATVRSARDLVIRTRPQPPIAASATPVEA